MSVFRAEDVRPSYLPANFRSRRQVEGEAAGGYWSEPQQVAIFHTRGWRKEDWIYPLVVFVTSNPEQELTGTEGHPGRSVDLGVPGTAAVYHDGMWWLDAERAEAVGVRQALSWRTDGLHSVTVRTPDRVYAVRGPRDVSLTELLRIARSLPLQR